MADFKIVSKSYTPEAAFGPTSQDFTIIPGIGEIELGSIGPPCPVFVSLHLGYTTGGHDCTLYIEVRSANHSSEVVISAMSLTGQSNINTIVSLQGIATVGGRGGGNLIRAYWRIVGSPNVTFKAKNTISMAAMF